MATAMPVAAGHEILHREAEHLAQVAHRGLPAIALPIGIGHKARRGIEGELGPDRRHAGRVERQLCLEPLQQIEHDEAGEVEQQQRHRIGDPVLFFVLPGAGGAVEAALDRAQHRLQPGALAVEDARHVAAERSDERNDDPAENEDLKPAE
jgi:hypothetical protein